MHIECHLGNTNRMTILRGWAGNAILGRTTQHGMKILLKLPRFNDDSADITARLIYFMSAGMMLVSLLFSLVAALTMPALLQRIALLSVIVIPACIVTMLLVTSRKLIVAGYLLLFVTWLTVTVGTITAGGVLAPIIIGYFVVISLSGIVAQNRISLSVTVLCIITAIAIALAQSHGWLPEPMRFSPIERASIYSFFLILAMLLQYITAGNIQHLLQSASESENRYKSLLESIPTITHINANDVGAATQYVSPQVKELLGYTQEDFLGDPGLWKKILHPDDRDRVLLENAATIESGQPFQLEYRLLTKERQIVWVRDQAILVHTADGKPAYWLGVWTDVTSRKQAEEEQADLISVMTKRTIQLQTAAEVSNAASSILDINILLPNVVELIRNHFDYYYVGIFLVDESRTWAYLRAATGEMGKKMIAAGHRLPIGDSSMIGWCIANRHARIALDVGEDAVRFRNPDLPLTRSEIALPLIKHGDVIGAMTIQSVMPSAFSRVDITALQTMADQVANAIENAQLFTERDGLIGELEKRNTELERFTYTVSHDLRSPLVTIRGFLGYLRQDAGSGDLTRFDRDLGRIANAVDRMQALLNDLLELSRVGRIMNPPEDIPFGQIVKETVDLLAGLVQARKVELKIERDLPVVHGDRNRLIEILQNLISNGIKFMGTQPNPVVEIGTRGQDEEGKTIFFVRDNGMGIDPRYQERIFGLFNRLNPDIDGTGIGLTLVKRIVEVHGGRIWVESHPGEGATFFFTLQPGKITT